MPYEIVVPWNARGSIGRNDDLWEDRCLGNKHDKSMCLASSLPKEAIKVAMLAKGHSKRVARGMSDYIHILGDRLTVVAAVETCGQTLAQVGKW